MVALGSVAANNPYPQSIQMARTLLSTDASGLASVTFPTAFAAAPTVVVASSNSDGTYVFMLATTTVTATGFTVAVRYLPGSGPQASGLTYCSWIACGPNTTFGAVAANQLTQYPLQGSSDVVATNSAGAGTVTFPVAFGSAPAAVMTLGDSNSAASIPVGMAAATTTTVPNWVRDTKNGVPLGPSNYRYNWLAANTQDNLGDVAANQTVVQQMQSGRSLVSTDATGYGTVTYPVAFAAKPNPILVHSNASAATIYVVDAVYTTSTTMFGLYVRDQAGQVLTSGQLYVSWVAWV